MKSKTFEEFWQFFLQVTFHEGNPERWTRRESKAKWCEKNLELRPGASIADLGCGDGLFDICLSRLGYKVTAIDSGKKILENARSEDDTKSVTFVSEDLRKVDFPKSSLDAVVILETMGLMSVEDDLDLLRRAFQWLKLDGKIAVDCPIKPSIKNHWSKEFSDGRLDAATSFNEQTRIHRLNFEFHPKTGEAFNLHDPYCLERDSGAGITRYIYTQPELAELLSQAGFKVESLNHYYGESYFGLVGRK